MKKTGLKECIYDFSVDYYAIIIDYDPNYMAR